MIVLKDGWLKDMIIKNMEEYAKLPEWLRITEDEIKNAKSYADI